MFNCVEAINEAVPGILIVDIPLPINILLPIILIESVIGFILFVYKYQWEYLE